MPHACVHCSASVAVRPDSSRPNTTATVGGGAVAVAGFCVSTGGADGRRDGMDGARADQLRAGGRVATERLVSATAAAQSARAPCMWRAAGHGYGRCFTRKVLP